MANALVKELRNIPRINPYQCYLNVLLFWHLLRKSKERWSKRQMELDRRSRAWGSLADRKVSKQEISKFTLRDRHIMLPRRFGNFQ